jgi:hypothetical protein
MSGRSNRVHFDLTCSSPAGRPDRRHGREDIEAFLGEAFVVVESGGIDHLTPGGATQKRHFARLRRRGQA